MRLRDDGLKSKISICFIMQYFQISGVETKLHAILRSLDQTLFDPVILCAQDDGLRKADFAELSIPIIKLPGLNPVSRLIQARDCLTLLVSRFGRRFDVVASFLGGSHPLECYLASFLCRRGFMFALVNKQRSGRAIDWHRRERLANCIVSLSHRTAEYHYKNSSLMSKVRVIYNGVDTSHFSPEHRGKRTRSEFGLPDDCLVFAYVARVATGKGHDVLLRSINPLSHISRNIHIAIAGQDKLSGWLQQNIAAYGIEKQVSYLGPIKDVAGLLSVCDGLVLASPSEGCGTVVLEAMASGLPVVVTASGSEEFVVDGVTGYVVPVGDHIALAERIGLLCASSEQRRAMGNAARAWVIKHCGIEQMTDGYIDVFREIGQR